MASFVEDVTKTLIEIQNDLVCQICQNHSRPGKGQWYRCKKLHQICQECKAKSKKCSCGKSISEQYCKMTEKLLNVKDLKFNCINTKHGCREILVENALEDHESGCIFRLVLCPFTAIANKCFAKVTFQDVIQHYEKKHGKIHVFQSSFAWTDNSMSGENCYFPTQKISINNRMFLLCGMSVSLIVYRWVYLHGSPIEAKHFSYTLKFYGKDATATFEGKVAAIDEPFEKLTGKCFTMVHKNFIAQFVDGNRKSEYSLEIRNLKEEVKDENYESGISDNDEDVKE